MAGQRRDLLRSLSAVGAVPAAWALAACGASGASPGAQTPEKLGPATLRLLYRGGQYEDEFHSVRNPDFEAKFPGVKVQMESTAGSDHYTKALAAAAGGTSTDLIWSSTGSGGYFSFAAGKIIRTVDDIASRDKFDFKQYYETSIKSLRWENKLYGLPILCHPSISMIWFNQSALEGVTTTMPDKSWTLDQLLELCKRLTKPTGDPGSSTWGYTVYTAARGIKSMARAWGGETFSADGKTSQFTSEPVMSSVTWLYEMMHKHRVSPTPDELKGIQGGADTLFGNGRGPMTRSSTSFLRNAQQQVKPPAKYWAAPHPKPSGPNTSNGSAWESDVWTMSATTKYPEQAWKLMLHLTDKESGLVLAKSTGSLNGRPDVWRAPEILNEHPIRKVMVETMEAAQPWTTTFNTRFVEYEAKMNELLAPVWTGAQAPTRSYMEDCNRQLQTVLDLPRPGAG
jgi:multiple sugar transport system substrate-binding protein